MNNAPHEEERQTVAQNSLAQRLMLIKANPFFPHLADVTRIKVEVDTKADSPEDLASLAVFVAAVECALELLGNEASCL